MYQYSLNIVTFLTHNIKYKPACFGFFLRTAWPITFNNCSSLDPSCLIISRRDTSEAPNKQTYKQMNTSITFKGNEIFASFIVICFAKFKRSNHANRAVTYATHTYKNNFS